MHRFNNRIVRLEQNQLTRQDPRIEQLQRVAGKSRYQGLSDFAKIFRIYLAMPETTPEARIQLQQGLEKVKDRMAEEKRLNENADCE